VVTREEYRRMEGFAREWELDRHRDEPLRRDEPLLRYVLVNVTLLGAGMAAWTAVVVGLMWMLF
jgi:hypothetical protein